VHVEMTFRTIWTSTSTGLRRTTTFLTVGSRWVLNKQLLLHMNLLHCYQMEIAWQINY